MARNRTMDERANIFNSVFGVESEGEDWQPADYISYVGCYTDAMAVRPKYVGCYTDTMAVRPK